MNKFFNYTDVKELIPKKTITANKYDFGNILLIGGEPGFDGAIMLSAESALKSGAGIINIFSLSGNVQNILEKRPEYMVLSKVDDLKRLLDKKITIIAGPGTTNYSRLNEILEIIYNDETNLILDAACIEIVKSKKFSSLPIITPHEGEAAKLLGINVDEISNNREYYAQKISDKFSVITVLKGYETIITDGNKIYICKDGDSSLAFAGSGDILAGLIGSFLAQGAKRIDSSLLGVSLHAYSAKNSKLKRGLTANELIDLIRKNLNQ